MLERLLFRTHLTFRLQMVELKASLSPDMSVISPIVTTSRPWSLVWFLKFEISKSKNIELPAKLCRKKSKSHLMMSLTASELRSRTLLMSLRLARYSYLFF